MPKRWVRPLPSAFTPKKLVCTKDDISTVQYHPNSMQKAVLPV